MCIEGSEYWLASFPGHSQILSRSHGEKYGRRPGTITTSRTENGGLDSYVMWTRFHNDGNVPTQYAASTASDRTVKAFCQQLRTLQVPSR